jgi:hypothetical protein
MEEAPAARARWTATIVPLNPPPTIAIVAGVSWVTVAMGIASLLSNRIGRLGADCTRSALTVRAGSLTSLSLSPKVVSSSR